MTTTTLIVNLQENTIQQQNTFLSLMGETFPNMTHELENGLYSFTGTFSDTTKMSVIGYNVSASYAVMFHGLTIISDWKERTYTELSYADIVEKLPNFADEAKGLFPPERNN